MVSHHNILVIDDDQSMRWVIQKALEKDHYHVTARPTAEEGLQCLETEEIPIIVVDIRMPGMSGLEFLNKIQMMKKSCMVIVMTAEATMQNAIEAMKGGAFDYLTKPFDMERLRVIVKKALGVLELNREVATLKGEIRKKFEADTVIGESASMEEIFKTIGKVASTDVTVLLTGESGTGKEVIARAIHYNSHRFGKPFVPVNLVAIPGDLMESELFGHEKGAFTGATAKKAGKFEHADGGTLFLDEIGDLGMGLQTKLLRVLQEKVIERVGGSGPIPVDVRILAATNSYLEEKVKKGTFREDLFFRLNVVPVQIPPLRDRKEDIPLLLDFFIQKSRHEMGMEVTGYSKSTLRLLTEYEWPGNVRELENMVKRAVVFTSGKKLTPDSFPALQNEPAEVSKQQIDNFDDWIRNNLSDFVHRMVQADATGIRKIIMDRVEVPLIEMVLREVGWNQMKAANFLGVNRNTLRKKITEHGINIRDHRPLKE